MEFDIQEILTKTKDTVKKHPLLIAGGLAVVGFFVFFNRGSQQPAQPEMLEFASYPKMPEPMAMDSDIFKYMEDVFIGMTDMESRLAESIELGQLRDDEEFAAIREEIRLVGENKQTLSPQPQRQETGGGAWIPQQAVTTPGATVRGWTVGYGGADYHQLDRAGRDAMAQTRVRLETDTAFRQSEIERAQSVIAHRTAQGLDITAQERYLASLRGM